MIVNNTSKGSSQLNQLRAELEKQEALSRLNKLEDYRKYLLPLLQGAVSNKWLEPSEFKTKEEFYKAYTDAYGRAKAFSEIISILETAEASAERTIKAMDPETKYEI